MTGKKVTVEEFDAAVDADEDLSGMLVPVEDEGTGEVTIKTDPPAGD